MALPGQAPAGGRQHGGREMAKLDEVFSPGRVLGRVFLCRQGFLGGIVDAGADAACEMEGAADADGTEAVELVGVIDDLCLQCLRGGAVVAAAVAVGGDGMDDGLDEGLVMALQLFLQDPAGQDRSLLGVASIGLSPGADLLAAGDVMEQGGAFDYRQVGNAFAGGDLPGVADDPEGMVPVVAGRIGGQRRLHDRLETAEDGLGGGHGFCAGAAAAGFFTWMAARTLGPEAGAWLVKVMGVPSPGFL